MPRYGTERYVSEDEPFNTLPIKIGAVIGLAILALILFFAFTVRVNAGEACIQTRFGKIHSNLDPGLHYHNPITMDATCYSIRKQVYEVSLVPPGESDSKADYIDYDVNARTKEGIDFDSAFTVQYHIEKDGIEALYQSGARSQERVNENVVKFYSRTVVPQILAEYDAETLYTGNLDLVSQKIQTTLAGLFQPYGVTIDYFGLKRGNFDDAYEEAIRQKALKVEQAKQKQLEQQYATEEAERQRIEAEGNAAAVRIQAQGQADATLIQAQADADSEQIKLEQRASVINANPALIEWQRIETIKSANVIYLPDEVLPILPIEDRKE